MNELGSAIGGIGLVDADHPIEWTIGVYNEPTDGYFQVPFSSTVTVHYKNKIP